MAGKSSGTLARVRPRQCPSRLGERGGERFGGRFPGERGALQRRQTKRMMLRQ